MIRPVSVRRGTRLSFLGGKKKEVDVSADIEEVNADTETSSIHSRTTNRTHHSKENHRLSFFRTQSMEKHSDVASPVSGTGSFEQTSREKTSIEVPRTPLGKKNSVRKRLSLLKLGKKNTKSNGMMGSLDEE